MTLTQEQGNEIVRFLLPYIEKCDHNCNGCLMQDQGELCLIVRFDIHNEHK